ncbi:MAG: helix-turn-helix transcriptional regulator [Cetobacterium sp.]|uniref:helix-turn-helix domain-containing protein n=1 Tax=Cetobacterium sp. TaxID=2071632 RepID=UPI002FC745C6
MKSGEFLKKIRLEKKLSLRQISYKTKLSHTFISEIEKGKLNGTLSSQEKILDALELTTDEKQEFYKLSELEKLPPNIKTNMMEMEKEILLLKKEIEEYKKKMSVENNSNNGHIIVGNGNNIKSSYAGTELCKELSELSEKDKEKVLKFINDYIKN